MFCRNVDDEIKSKISENVTQVFKDKLIEDEFKVRQKRTYTFMKGQLLASAVLEELDLPKNSYLNEKIDYLEQTFNSNSSLIL